jgi:hypothetical protein
MNTLCILDFYGVNTILLTKSRAGALALAPWGLTINCRIAQGAKASTVIVTIAGSFTDGSAINLARVNKP